jgi:predicted hydrocarbon binding protein
LASIARSGYFYPNRAVLDLLRGLEDLVGKNGLSAVLNLSGLKHWIESYPPDNLDKQVDFSEIAAIHLALEDIYGVRGGRNLTRRAGWRSVEGVLQSLGALQEMDSIAGQPQPPLDRLHAGLTAMAEAISKASDQQVTVNPSAPGVVVSAQPCPYCWGRQASEPLCFTMLGALQGAADRLVGAEAATVQESQCIASGGESCLFIVAAPPVA